MTELQKERLQIETQDLINKVNKLQDFMRTYQFYVLPRADKTLLYKQFHAMLTYLEVLGERMELHNIELAVKPL